MARHSNLYVTCGTPHWLIRRKYCHITKNYRFCAFNSWKLAFSERKKFCSAAFLRIRGFFGANATAFCNVIIYLKLSKKWLIVQSAFFPFYMDSCNSQTVSKHNSQWFCPLETVKRLGFFSWNKYFSEWKNNLSASQNRCYFPSALLIRMFHFHLVVAQLQELQQSQCGDFIILHTKSIYIFCD